MVYNGIPWYDVLNSSETWATRHAHGQGAIFRVPFAMRGPQPRALAPNRPGRGTDQRYSSQARADVRPKGMKYGLGHGHGPWAWHKGYGIWAMGSLTRRAILSYFIGDGIWAKGSMTRRAILSGMGYGPWDP